MNKNILIIVGIIILILVLCCCVGFGALLISQNNGKSKVESESRTNIEAFFNDFLRKDFDSASENINSLVFNPNIKFVYKSGESIEDGLKRERLLIAEQLSLLYIKLDLDSTSDFELTTVEVINSGQGINAKANVKFKGKLKTDSKEIEVTGTVHAKKGQDQDVSDIWSLTFDSKEAYSVVNEGL